MRTFFLPLLLLTLASTCVRAQLADRQTENVILITMDGLRWQELFGGAVDSMIANPELTSDAGRMKEVYLADNQAVRRAKLMPWFWETLATEGQVFGNRWVGSKVNCSNRYWFSYPGYNEILTGYADGRINSNDKKWNPNKTVLEWLHEKPEFRGRVAAFGSWDVFDWIVNEQRSGIPVNSGYNQAEGERITERERFLNTIQDQSPLLWGSVRPDVLTHQFMMEYLRRDHPRVVYISYGETDDFAHDGSYNRYLDAAHNTDKMWRELWDFLQSDPVYAGKTSVVITTDHGRGESPMTDWKSHGTSIPGADQIWLAIIGPDTPAKGMIENGPQLYQRQVAATVASLLGYNFQEANEDAGAVVPGAVK
ncbi:alkaline phosphatase family protein [Neolewinella lacunae]|uniref:Alkaline phosphatase family protein n=1 Tax=Neolewinella lacunae TaxID=1517758 RepID=A0A923T8A1_9BACT|nr:alkaline phosphatase family protein [Neolewinella lacunae]MBC6994344.1 alkaline phosphatase family protein [Neolewinella lacunae]MDN3635809.1 alkaline phosphatase family protein [Neolewinella lacunae]